MASTGDIPFLIPISVRPPNAPKFRQQEGAKKDAIKSERLRQSRDDSPVEFAQDYYGKGIDDLQKNQDLLMMQAVSQMLNFTVGMKDDDIPAVLTLGCAISVNCILEHYNILDRKSALEFHYSALNLIAGIASGEPFDLTREAAPVAAPIGTFLDKDRGQTAGSVFNEPEQMRLVGEYVRHIPTCIRNASMGDWANFLFQLPALMRDLCSLVIAVAPSLGYSSADAGPVGEVLEVVRQLQQGAMLAAPFALWPAAVKDRLGAIYGRVVGGNDDSFVGGWAEYLRKRSERGAAQEDQMGRAQEWVEWRKFGRGMMQESWAGKAFGKLVGYNASADIPFDEQISTTNQLFERLVGWAWSTSRVITVTERAGAFILCAFCSTIDSTILHSIDAVKQFYKLNNPRLASLWVSQLKQWEKENKAINDKREQRKSGKKKASKKKEAKLITDMDLNKVKENWQAAHTELSNLLEDKERPAPPTGAYLARTSAILSMEYALSVPGIAAYFKPISSLAITVAYEYSFRSWRTNVRVEIAKINSEIKGLSAFQDDLREVRCGKGAEECDIPKSELGAGAWLTPKQGRSKASEDLIAKVRARAAARRIKQEEDDEDEDDEDEDGED
jgi:hypothetical protein